MQTLATTGFSAHAQAHRRLAYSAILGFLIAALLSGVDLATRALVGWDAGVAILLFGIWRMMSNTTLPQLKRKAAQQDESAAIILGVMICAIVASLFGVLSEAREARHASASQAGLHLGISLSTLVLSWLCMHVLFATRYAHRYYGERGMLEPDCGGLIFPEDDASPDYSEFLYFALCIGMTYQVSDIMTKSRGFRRLVMFHAAISFFFNTFVLALAVNLLSGFG
jgi:uncharacterized membrane protein